MTSFSKIPSPNLPSPEVKVAERTDKEMEALEKEVLAIVGEEVDSKNEKVSCVCKDGNPSE